MQKLANVRFVAYATIVGLLLTSACATLFKGPTEKVNFSSNPEGAKIYVNGQMIGETPYQMNLSSKDTHTIEFRKEGYETRTYVINSKMAAGYLVLDILFGFIPVIVDAATGAWMTLETASVMAQLEAKEASAP
jgi:hypothetical protein